MRALHPAAAAGLTAAAVALAASSLGQGGALELWSLDARFRLRGPRAPHPEVVLVVFDDATDVRAPELFARRAGWARVVRAAKEAGAKTLAIDGAFDTPEHLLGPALGERVALWAGARQGDAPPGAEALLLSDIARELGGDDDLAAALQTSGNVVLMTFAEREGRAGAPAANLSRARYGQSSKGARAPAPLRGVLTSIPKLSGKARAAGFTDVYEDDTNTVRRVRMAQELDGAVYMPLSVAAAAVHLGLSRAAISYLGQEQQVKLGERTVPLDDDALWLDLRGPARTFPTYSAADLVDGKLPRGALDGKLVLLGVTRHDYDVVRTSFDRLPGVELQATAVDNVLRGEALRRLPPWQGTLCLGGAAVLALLLFAFRALGPRTQVAGLLLLTAAWVAACAAAFQASRLWLPAVGPLAVLLGGGVAGLATAYLSEARLRRRLRTDFAHYLGEDALEQLLRSPGALALGGERRTLTVLFSDIRDFTTLSEALPPDRLVALLNTYLSPMTRAVLNRGGLLDKYIGDAVMAVFGAPVPFEDHAGRALRCVLDMHRALQALNQGPLQAYGLTLSIGVGVNTGEMVVGNMGSEERFDYTVTGDAVNLASRLEGLTKRYGVFCLVGDGARRAAGDGFTFRSLDLVQVKGKHQAVEVHELVAADGVTLAPWQGLDGWEQAVAAFRAGRLGEARQGFQAFALANPADVVAKTYLERLAGLPDVAPEGFSAVTAFDSK